MPQVKRVPPGFNIHHALSLIGLRLQDIDRRLGEEIPLGAPDTWMRRQELFKEIIKKARQDTLRKVHPDLFQDEAQKARALERTKQVNEAVEILLLIKPNPPRTPHHHHVAQQVVIMPGFNPFYGMSGTTTSASGASPFFIRIYRG